MADDAGQDKSTDLTTDLTTELTPGPTKPGRGRWILLTALSLSFLGVSVVLLVMALNQRQSVQTDRVAASGESPSEDTSTGRPITTAKQEPEELSVPFEWSPDGLALLPFGTQQEEAIDVMSAALGAPPDEVEEVTGGECTPGTDARWEQMDLRFSFDPSGSLAQVSFPSGLGRTSVGGSDTLGELQDAFPDLQSDNVPPQPEAGVFESYQTWSVEGADGTASGRAAGNQADSPVDSVSLNSNRFDGVECFE